ncbi:TIGR02680 family protein [Nocardiopsis tropica]|uniref:TIGR02680 family protein n=1 Tax=Nocardiopsis tropica TaxID=109330 RepID=UPI0036091C0C
MTAPLPEPGRERWQPLRVGLVDLFYYEDEQFWFRDGRLLLRGNNGTGKSKVLALTLPFLLDGELSAHRVEPDGDPKKRMEWNLLLGGEYPHGERLGYAWIEFGRRTAGGGAEFRTLGCGLKAVSGRGIARHWYFSTPQRIGSGDDRISLLDATRTALSRDRLADAVEGRGMVYDRARDYRRAVDEALFGLGEQRYGALVDLLVQLRQPQLSKRPSETALSRALTESLPPVDQAVIADVAEAYRELEDDETELNAMADAERAASAFLGHYRDYARAAARRAARPPRTEHSRYERLTTDRNEAEAARAGAEAALVDLEARAGDLAERVARLHGQDQTLRRSPEMDSARDLDRARAEAERTAARAAQAAGDAARAGQDAARAEHRHGQARRRLDDAAADLGAVREKAAGAAARAGVEADHRHGVDAPLDPGRVHGGEHAAPVPRTGDGAGAGQPPSPAPGADHTERSDRRASRAREAAEALVGRRTRALDHTADLITAAERTRTEHRGAHQRLEDTEGELADLADRRAAAEQHLAGTAEAHVLAVRDHLGGCAELRPQDPESTLDLVAAWVTTLDGPDPARLRAQETAQQVEAGLAAREAELGLTRTALDRDRQDLEAERDALAAGGQGAPPAPHTRTADRAPGRPGAPLWKLVDFADHLGPAPRAMLEAALEASGLLDAWVGPDGALTDPAGHDVRAVPGDPVNGPHLGTLLRPAVDPHDTDARAVAPATLRSLLAGIGLGPDTGAATWVDTDGSFQVGVLRGTWSKDEARHLGEGAREQARRDRLALIASRLEDIAHRDQDAERELAGLARRRTALRAELAALPDDTALRAAHAAVADAVRTAVALTRRRDERAARAEQARQHRQDAERELADASAELGTPTEPAALAAHRDALAAYRVALAGLWPAARTHAEALRALADEHGEAERTRDVADDLAERAEQARLEASAADQRHTTLGETVGAAVAELNRRLARVEADLRAARAEEKALGQDRTDALDRRGRAAGRVETLDADITESIRSRAEAIEGLRAFSGTGLMEVALPDLDTPDPGQPWAADPAVRLARAVERELDGTDDSPQVWDRLQKNLSQQFKNLQDALSRHGHGATSWPEAGVIIVRVTFQGREQPVPELAGALAAEVAARRSLLSAREREVLENHLLTEVTGTLQELIATAERQVLRMNGELEDRPTSTGMRLRLSWRLRKDAPEGVDTARDRLLRQTADAWSQGDRAAVGDFLQRLIEQERAKDPTGSWFDRLARALDYRSWHHFAVERHQHGQWSSATGPASGGERVLSASVPLFAAASSYYATASNPHAPRLITLDEAFAGVDDDSRAKCLGLLRAFDLDVAMTSEREWGCYPQVPGLAIAQLSRVDGVPAVLVTRWEWDGRERFLSVDPAASDHADTDAEPDTGGTGGQETLWS